MRVFAGLVSDPFFMDVEAALRTDISGKLSFQYGREHRSVSRRLVDRRRGPVCSDRQNASMASRWSQRDRGEHCHAPAASRSGSNVSAGRRSRTSSWRTRLAIRARRASSFAISTIEKTRSRSPKNIDHSTSRVSTRTWPSWTVSTVRLRGRWTPDSRHPLRDLLIADFLILDLAQPFAPGNFLEIERALIANRPHKTAGGRWLDDDILDELLTLVVNGGRGERLGDGVDAPTKPASFSFPYVREPNNRTDLPLPAFLRS